METRRWLRAVVVDLHMVVVLMIDLKCWCCCLIEIMRRRLRSSVSVMSDCAPRERLWSDAFTDCNLPTSSRVVCEWWWFGAASSYCALLSR